MRYSKKSFLEKYKDIFGEMDADLKKLYEEFPIPNQFWTASASSSGKYHPDISAGSGGLARHTVLAMYWVIRWANFMNASNEDIEVALVATMLHDTYKGGWAEKWTTTVPEHPLLASGQVKKICKNTECSTEARIKLLRVADAIRSHMGIWSPDPECLDYQVFKPIHLDDMTVPSKLLALADYSASQKIYDDMKFHTSLRMYND